MDVTGLMMVTYSHNVTAVCSAAELSAGLNVLDIGVGDMALINNITIFHGISAIFLTIWKIFFRFGSHDSCWALLQWFMSLLVLGRLLVCLRWWNKLVVLIPFLALLTYYHGLLYIWSTPLKSLPFLELTPPPLSWQQSYFHFQPCLLLLRVTVWLHSSTNVFFF